jgi:hypothetical protein
LKNIILTKNISAMFLAAILVAGTIIAFSPSFMVGIVQAVPYPDMDREKKEDKKSVSVSSLKCNNINVNVNGLELDVFPPFLGGGDLAAEAVEPNTEGSSFAAGNNGDGSQINDFRFICINNNNNTVIEREEDNETEDDNETDECETCFTTILTEEELNAIIADFEVEGIVSLQDICNFVDANSQTEEGRSNIAFVLANAFNNAEVSSDLLNDILECFEEVYGGIFPRVAF